MALSLTIVLAILGVTMGIAATHRRNGYLILAAVMSWILLLCFVILEPNTILIPTRLPITSEILEVFLTIITVIIEIAGLYSLWNRR